MRTTWVITGERRIAAVPLLVKAVFAAALVAHIGWQAATPRPPARGEDLATPPPQSVLRVATFGDPVALSAVLTLRLQAFDNQAGVSIPYLALDYNAVEAWLGAALGLDPVSHYPLMMAAHLYGQVPDQKRQRQMFDFVHRAFLEAPERRWRWLAHAALMAKHKLGDLPLALRYADDISRYAGTAQSWARQMRIFLLEDLGEREAATVLLGGLLAGGEISDPAEMRFLSQRLEELKNAEISSTPSRFR